MSDFLRCTILLSDDDDRKATLTVSPELLYVRARTVLPSLLQLDRADRQSALMKVAVKGLFLSFGDWMLEQLYKSKEHPRPGKQDDLILWYIDLFTRVLLAQGLKSELILTGVRNEAHGCITITEVSTRPVAQALPASDAADDGRATATN